jgi:hypothetical protein
MTLDIVLDILMAIGEKILPRAINQFIPLVKVQPKKLRFSRSEWTSNLSFFLYSRAKQVLFDVYLLIEIGDAKSEAFELSKTDKPKDIELTIGNIELNYEILRFNGIYENDKEFILLKIAQMDPQSLIPFRIAANTDSVVCFKILKYSKEENRTLHKAQAGAISFEIPLKGKGEIRPKSISLLMKKND